MSTTKKPARRLNIDKLREDFPILRQQAHGHPLVYLDSAATTHKPRSVVEALQYFYEHDNSNVHRGLHVLSNRATEAYEKSRACVARFLNAADPAEIIFTKGTTEAINLVAASWGRSTLKAGDVILLTEMEHHANLVPWQLVAQQTGARLRFIPVDVATGLLELDKIDALLTPEVKILSFTHISNTLGTINPVKELCAKAKAVGALTLVDAAQSSGHAPLDVQAIGCDFLVFSGHKMCAPTGIGILYGKKALLDSMPPYQGGGEMILSVQWEKSTYKPSPARFEAGTPPIAQAIGLQVAIDYLDHLGMAVIEEYDHSLADYAVKKLLEIPGLRILGPHQNRAGLASFVLDDIHAHDIVTFADQRGVALRGGHHCTQPLMRKLGIPSAARASFYFYNRLDEVDRLADVLREAKKFFSRGT